MAVTITINAKEERNDNFQIVFFTITKKTNIWKFSHGAVPSSLTTDAQIKAWLGEPKRRDEIIEIIQNKIANGTYQNEHPPWIEWESQLDYAIVVSQLKAILKKMARRIG